MTIFVYSPYQSQFRIGGGDGFVVFRSLKHGYARRLLDRYQSMYGNRGLQTEASYLNGQAVPYGTRGSVRLDVFEPSTGTVWDYKFTPHPSLPASRVQKIINQGPAGINSGP